MSKTYKDKPLPFHLQTSRPSRNKSEYVKRKAREFARAQKRSQVNGLIPRSFKYFTYEGR
ncbi:MAG: hypothetical protein E6Q97_11415 [Desulfurellales bacterium]|nr:MAG: hypothetical protein E6Q97_11415 [Desulfurellales bacterium]